MSLRSADKGRVAAAPRIENVSLIDKDGNSGKPCIDFQPDDRWQIKEDEVTNSKNKDLQSNGRRSQRLRNSKSSDSAVANGENTGSGSEDETRKNGEKTDLVCEEVAEHLNLRATRSRRKRTLSDTEPAKDKIQTAPDKKVKTNDVEKLVNTSKNVSVIEEGNENVENTKDVNESDFDRNCEAVPDKNGADLDSSIEVLDEDQESDSEMISSSPEVSLDGKDDDCKIVSKPDECVEVDFKGCSVKEDDKSPQDKEEDEDEEDDSESVSKSEEINEADNSDMDDKSKDSKNDVDIEIINLNEEDKKDEESDSEIQVISLEEMGQSDVAEDFPSTSSTNTDVRVSAGYPYYNSLKEKIPSFKAGDYKPVKFPHTGTLLLAENEVIIESPSLLVPLLIKEADAFPTLEGEVKKHVMDNIAIMRPNIISRKNFFQSSVGQFLINLGTSRVQEWYHRDMKHTKIKQLKRKKEGQEEIEKAIEVHDKRHNQLKEINAIFSFRMRQCKHCEFKSESLIVMEGHNLMPHVSARRELRCNFCSYMARDPEQIVFHFEAMHGKKAILEANITFHECIFCSFQSHLKTKVNAHMNRCRKHFIPSQNLAPPFDFEFPGVTTKPVTIADVVGHRRMLLNSAKGRLPGLAPSTVSADNSANSAFARKKLASVLSKLTGQNAYVDMKNPSLMKQLMSPQGQLSSLSGSSIQLPPGIVITRPRGVTMQQMRPMSRYPQPRGMPSIRGVQPRRPYPPNLSSNLVSAGISITPVSRNGVPPRGNAMPGGKNVTLTPISTASNRNVSQKPGPPQPVALFTNVAGSPMIGQPQPRMPVNVNITMRPARPPAPYQRLNTPPSQVVKGSSGNTFVVCEICDSYIKDLEELRTHMNWVHKVKIHPKMLVSRPPLNCQKCQWRFFTDQGLERHLLGAHGLVTTNMQEMANKNQDGGRCIICGAVFTYKLVSHMTQVHKVTLKPAHLSYKCTVCTATFTLYRLFESHVYNVHSGSAKRAAEDSSEPPPKKFVLSRGPKRCKECGFVTENLHDHLIKKHIKGCSVKLCRIEKCEKCLYSSEEMLVIRMSDFGLEEEDDSDESEDDSSDDSKNSDNKEKETG